MGDSITEGSIASIDKPAGSQVAADDIIAQIETDKVTIDVRAPESGTVTEIMVEEGDTVTVGQHVATLEPGDAPAGAAAAPATPAASAPSTPAPAAPKAAAAPAPTSAAPAAPAAPAAADAGARTETRVPMTRLRKRIAERLKASQNTNALLTTYNEVDMSNLMDLRNQFKDAFLEKHGAKLGFMSAFVKASATALKDIPSVNATIVDNEETVYYDYVDISVAVGTPKGLVTPVLRDVQTMNFADIEKEIASLGKQARDGTLAIDQLAGGTFTISNGGVYGSLLSSPIVNPPQSAILGMHGIQKRPVVGPNDSIVVRPMMYIALTYDHRLIDGREAVTFLRRIKDIVENPVRLVLDL
eukprot:CAMPEP_0198708540 /NCGR_PEP_ID=MMETSP1471-20131121/1162_1 /TAXON_ID=41880 /ORGANISM="Pycnococcus provasolii, Strain RCC733" /LENGTH=356 /DNA_ID=CAMNT_0044467797 /DNA_START=307 /DNA_END=1377 /DNA_ORIENTATION=+